MVFQDFPIKEAAGILAGAVSLAAYIPYIISTLQRRTKPSRSSWWIWTVIGFLILLSYRSAGANNTIWVPLGFFIGPTVIAILSLRFGENTGLNRLDKVCLLGAGASVFFWIWFDSAIIALYVNIFMDFLGFLPTFKKTFKNAASESRSTWLLFFIGSVLNIAAIEKFITSIALYPIYMFCMDIIMLALLFRPKHSTLNITK